MADNVGAGGHWRPIAAAFAAQAGIFLAIGAVLTGTVAAPASPVAVPAGPSLLPFVTPETPPLLPYALSFDASTARGVFFQDSQPAPGYAVPPGRDLVVTLDVKVPDTVQLTELSLNLSQDANAATTPQGRIVFRDATHPLAPGQHTFTVDWTGSASELRPGTKWGLYMSTENPEWTDLVAVITVAYPR